jgi:metal-responsive CopG/Arc/MetJ family transcriptional regulator
MKEKTSLTVSLNLLAKIERLAGPKLSRSAFIQWALRNYIAERKRPTMHARDLQDGANRNR